MTEIWIKYEDHLLNNGISKVRRKKLRVMFNIISRFLDLTKAKREDVEDFVNKLNRNHILQANNKPYSGNSKQDLKKFLRQFFKWYKGKNEFYPPEVSWLKTSIPKDERPEEKAVIDKKDIPRLAKMFRKYDYEMAVLIQFDSGFRIQELMSVKKSDLSFDEFDNDKKCWWVKCNKSKTFPRKIPIPLFTDEISTYTKSQEYEDKGKEDPLLDINYTYYTNHLKKYSIKMFGLDSKGKPIKPITSHCLRHSSATFYAKEYNGDVPLLAQRYGWSFDARELKTYVRVSGAYNKRGAVVSYTKEMAKLKEENQTLKERMDKLEKAIVDIAKRQIRKRKG